MLDEVTYDGFIDALASESLFVPDDDEDDSDACRAYWKSVNQYTLQLSKLYSVSSKGHKLIEDAIKRRYPLEDKNFNELTQYKLDLSRIYQTVSTAFNINLPKNCQLEEYATVAKLYLDPAFRKFVESFYKHVLAVLKSLTDQVDQQIQEMNRLENAEAHKVLDRIRSTSQDLLRQLERKAGEVDTVLDNARKQSLDASNALSNADEKLKAATETSDNARKAADSVLTNVLTILGVFIAIIVAFISGFFSVLLADRGNISPIAQVCLAHFLLMGHVLFNLIFLFMFMISRLSYKSISVLCLYCNDKEHLGMCQLCQCKCKWYKRLWRKYPYLVLTNWAIVIGYVILFLWWFIDEFVYSHFEAVLHNSTGISIFVLLLMVALLIAVFIVIPYKIINKNKVQESDMH